MRNDNFKARSEAKQGNFQDAAMLQEKGKQKDEVTRRSRKTTNRKRNSSSSNRNRGGSRARGNNNTGHNGEIRVRQDFQWYNQYPELTESVARLDFARPLGSALQGLPLDDVTLGNVTITGGRQQLPGIMTLRLAPSIGRSISPESPFNRGSRALFSYLRQNRSGTAPYEQTDLGMIMTAVADAYSFANFMMRAYAKATAYDVFNKYMPLALLQADGLNPNDFITNRANLRYYINQFIYALRQYKLPASVTLFARRAFLYSYVYHEGESIRDQMYQYAPTGFSILSDGTEQNPATSVTVVPLPYYTTGTLMSVNDLWNYGKEMLSALSVASSSSFAYVQADIINAFGTNDSAYIAASTLPDEVALPIVFNQDVLYQMKNADIIFTGHAGMPTIPQFLSTLNITQYTSVGLTYAISSPQLKFTSAVTNALAHQLLRTEYGSWLDVPTATPTVDQIVEYSRLKSSYEAIDHTATPEAYGYTISCGSEIVVSCDITTLDTSGASLTATYPQMYIWSSTEASSISSIMSNFARAKCFDYAPMQMCLYGDIGSDGVGFTPVKLFWDFDNYTYLNPWAREELNNVALLSLFKIPEVTFMK